MELWSMLGGSLDGKGVWAEWIHVQAWLSPFIVHLKPPQHCSSPTPQHKVKHLKKKETVLPPPPKKRIVCHAKKV